MWIAEVHRTAHPESQPGSYANVASGVVSMLSPARRSRIGPMWVARVAGRMSNQTPISLGNSSPAPGVLHECLGWLPNLFGAKRRNHSSTVPKTGLRLVCSMRTKTCLYGHIKRPARTTKIYPRGSPAKPVGRLSDAGIVRPAPARHNVIFFAGNHPTVDAFEDRIKSPIPWHAP